MTKKLRLSEHELLVIGRMENEGLEVDVFNPNKGMEGMTVPLTPSNSRIINESRAFEPQ